MRKDRTHKCKKDKKEKTDRARKCKKEKKDGKHKKHKKDRGCEVDEQAELPGQEEPEQEEPEQEEAEHEEQGMDVGQKQHGDKRAAECAGLLAEGCEGKPLRKKKGFHMDRCCLRACVLVLLFRKHRYCPNTRSWGSSLVFRQFTIWPSQSHTSCCCLLTCIIIIVPPFFLCGTGVCEIKTAGTYEFISFGGIHATKSYKSI